MLDQLSVCVFSSLFFCLITFFFSSSPASFLFMCVIYDVWCFMKRFSWFFFFFFFLRSFSLGSSFTLTSTQIWALAAEERNPVPITASCVCYGCHNRPITKAKRFVVWMWEESLLFVSNSPHYQLFFLPRPSVYFSPFLVKAMLNLPQIHYLSCCEKAVKFKTMVNADITRFS